jgi:aliphatic nitrilase
MAEAIKIRATAHSFHGKDFTIGACSTVSEEIIAAMSADRPQNRDLLERPNSAFSGVIDPHGNLIGEALIDEEGIVYAEIDLGDCVRPKLMHDIIGGYNRFDIFNLTVDRTPRASALFVDEIPPADEPREEEPS